MMMNGKLLKLLDEMKQNFSIDDLVACYYSGELFFFLQKLGEYEKLAALQRMTRNAYLLVQLYEILDFKPEWTETEIRSRFS